MSGPGNGNGDGDDLPEPIIEPIRNFADLPEPVRREITDGALLTIWDSDPDESSVGVNVLSGVLVHFDRLFRILQAAKSGFEVKRTGRVPEVVGAKRLSAFPAFAGSYALPLRLEAPQGELVGDDRGAFAVVMELLESGEGSLEEKLSVLPERVGDELYALLQEIAHGASAVAVEAVRNNAGVGRVEVGSEAAKSRVTWLKALKKSDLASESLQGKLFRIDTKRNRIAIDSQEEDESVILEATFVSNQLETLRQALNHEVEIDVEVVEEKRAYEQTARNRIMSVVSIRRLESDSAPSDASDDPEAGAPEAESAI